MIYEKKNWNSNSRISSDDFNRIESGISYLYNEINDIDKNIDEALNEAVNNYISYYIEEDLTYKLFYSKEDQIYSEQLKKLQKQIDDLQLQVDQLKQENYKNE